MLEVANMVDYIYCMIFKIIPIFRHMKHARRSAFLDDVGFSQRSAVHGRQRFSKRVSQVGLRSIKFL